MIHIFLSSIVKDCVFFSSTRSVIEPQIYVQGLLLAFFYLYCLFLYCVHMLRLSTCFIKENWW